MGNLDKIEGDAAPTSETWEGLVRRLITIVEELQFDVKALQAEVVKLKHAAKHAL